MFVYLSMVYLYLSETHLKLCTFMQTKRLCCNCFILEDLLLKDNPLKFSAYIESANCNLFDETYQYSHSS